MKNVWCRSGITLEIGMSGLNKNYGLIEYPLEKISTLNGTDSEVKSEQGKKNEHRMSTMWHEETADGGKSSSWAIFNNGTASKALPKKPRPVLKANLMRNIKGCGGIEVNLVATMRVMRVSHGVPLTAFCDKRPDFLKYQSVWERLLGFFWK